MTVYIDVLFVVNMIIDYFLLLVSGILAKSVCSRLRFLFASTLGALYSVLVYLSPVTFFHSCVLKILMAFIICLLAFGFISLKHYLRCTIIFATAGFLLGGILYGVYFMMGQDVMQINNFAVYLHISPVLLIFSTVLIYLLISVFTYFLKPKAVDIKTSCTVQITYRGKSISSTGFIDTGNNITDIFTDYPVILCKYEAIKGLLYADESIFFMNNISAGNSTNLPRSLRIIPVSTVSGSTLLPAFKPDFVCLEAGKERYEISRVYIAVFNGSNYNSDHTIILNPELIIEKNQGGNRCVP